MGLLSSTPPAQLTFEPIDLYPELRPIQNAWQIIRAEALACGTSMLAVNDSRVVRDGWWVLPMLPEREDRDKVPVEICSLGKSWAEETVKLVETLPHLRGYAFSMLKPATRIHPHHHHHPYVTAALCLQSGGDAFLKVDSQRQDFCDGEFVIFDYRKTHEVVNQGDGDRIVLLILLDKKNVKR